MNRRSFLSFIGLGALTPLIPKINKIPEVISEPKLTIGDVFTLDGVYQYNPVVLIGGKNTPPIYHLRHFVYCGNEVSFPAIIKIGPYQNIHITPDATFKLTIVQQSFEEWFEHRYPKIGQTLTLRTPARFKG